MPLRKVFVDKEGDDDKKSINDALSWFLQKFTLIHFPGHSELQLLSNTTNRSYQTFAVWQYGLWSFQMRDTELERFLPKNQHTKRK